MPAKEASGGVTPQTSGGMEKFVNLPSKWSIKGTAMPETISDVLDAQNRKRGRILHKRVDGKTAHELVLNTRYGVRQSINGDVTESTIFFGEEHGEQLFVAGNLALPEYTVKPDGRIQFIAGPNLEKYRVQYEALVESAYQWGLSHYPDFSNPNKYWDGKTPEPGL